MKVAGSFVMEQRQQGRILPAFVALRWTAIEKSIVSIPLLIAALVLLPFLRNAAAEEPPWKSWRDSPKQFQWKGTIKGESVEMVIKSGVFEKAAHKVREKDGMITSVDGYEAYCDPSSDAVLPHIQTWRIKWGGREIVLPKGIYTSVFLPYLRSPKPQDDALYRESSVLVEESKDGNALSVTMNCGQDGVTYRINFTITKDGQARRVMLETRS